MSDSVPDSVPNSVLDSVCDLLIVGGGPAGLAVAIQARLAGMQATVVERCRGPIDKACGEGLLPSSLAMLRAAGVELDPSGCAPFRGIRYIDGETVAEADFLEGPGLGVQRLTLSAGLLARAEALGVRLLLHTEAHSFEERGDRVVLETSAGTLQGRYLVAADGLHSQVRRLAGFEVTKAPGRRLGVRRHFRGAPWSPFVEVYWGDGFEGYVTPAGPERVNVAFLWSGGKGDHETFLHRVPGLAARLGPAEDSVRGAGPFGVSVSAARRGRVLLVGDAAGYVDAITGEGLGLALESAALLVHHVRSGDLDGYGPALARLSGLRAFLTRSLVKVAARPWLRRRVVRALARSPGAFQAMLALNNGHWGLWRALPSLSWLGVRMIA